MLAGKSWPNSGPHGRPQRWNPRGGLARHLACSRNSGERRELVEVIPRLSLGRVLVVEDLGEIAGNHQERKQRLAVTGGVSIKELAEYLGHADPAFTFRVYAHLLPSSHDRARTVINDRFGCLVSDPGNRERSHGTETEQA